MQAPNIHAFEVYKSIVKYSFDREGPREKVWQNKNLKERVCLFCDRAVAETSFRNDAHIIPAALGNRTLFTYVECDECNHKFGTTIEQDLINDLAIIRAMSCNRARKGHSKYKLSSSFIKSGVESNNVEVEIVEGDDGIQATFMPDDNFKLDIKSPSINYVSVGKALARMILLLMDYADAVQYENLIGWINGEQTFLPVFFKGFFPGAGFVNTSLIILKKSDGRVLGIPPVLGIFTYANFIYYFPFPSEDLSHASNFPLPIHIKNPEYPPTITQIRCYADEPLPPMKRTFVMKYEEIDS